MLKNTPEIQKNSIYLPPRLIRFKNITLYTGFDRNRFNREMRPSLTEIKIGVQGIAFDRLEVDQWIDDYIENSTKPTDPARRH